VCRGRHVSAIPSSRAKIKLKIQWYMCSQFYSDWRASNSLILIQNFCAIFQPLTKEIAGAALGQHPQNCLVVAARLNP
jgi:hypothetical protein